MKHEQLKRNLYESKTSSLKEHVPTNMFPMKGQNVLHDNPSKQCWSPSRRDFRNRFALQNPTFGTSAFFRSFARKLSSSNHLTFKYLTFIILKNIALILHLQMRGFPTHLSIWMSRDVQISCNSVNDETCGTIIKLTPYLLRFVCRGFGEVNAWMKRRMARRMWPPKWIIWCELYEIMVNYG